MPRTIWNNSPVGQTNLKASELVVQSANFSNCGVSLQKQPLDSPARSSVVNAVISDRMCMRDSAQQLFNRRKCVPSPSAPAVCLASWARLCPRRRPEASRKPERGGGRSPSRSAGTMFPRPGSIPSRGGWSATQPRSGARVRTPERGANSHRGAMDRR